MCSKKDELATVPTMATTYLGWRLCVSIVGSVGCLDIFLQVGQTVLLLWTQWSGVTGQESPRNALWGRRWPACVEGEAEVLLPGRAPYAVVIEPRQHGCFGNDGVAQ